MKILDTYKQEEIIFKGGGIIMKFIVAKEVFEKLDNVCFGIVVAKGG